MTIHESADYIRTVAAAAGLTPAQYARAINNLPPAVIVQAMEELPTTALEWGLRFESLSIPKQCPACAAFRLHHAYETATYHPLAGHGYQEGQGWSSPEAEQAHIADVRGGPK